MRCSATLYLALASGWATEHEAFRPVDLGVRNNQSGTRRHPSRGAFLSQSLPYSNNFRAKRHGWDATSSRSTRLFSDRHSPDQRPTDIILSLGEPGKAYFAKKAETDDSLNESSIVDEIDNNVVESTTGNALHAPEVKNDETIPTQEEENSQPQQEEEEEAALVADSVQIDQEIEVIDTQQEEEEDDEPAKPFMTPEQQEEFKQATARFVKEVLSPLTEVQPGVPADTIKGAALAAAVVAFFASKGIVVTSAAGLSAAYIAISQGVVGDIARTIGGIAWEAQLSALKLIEIANPNLQGLSKGLAANLVAAMQDANDWSRAMEELEASEKTNKTRLAFLESEREMSNVLLEAESAILAADAATAHTNKEEGGLEIEGQNNVAAAVTASVEASEPLRAEEVALFAAQLQDDQRQQEEETASTAARLDVKRKEEEEAAAAALAKAEAKQKQLEEVAILLAAQVKAEREQQEEEANAAAEAAAEVDAQLKRREEESAAIIEAQRKKQEEEAAAIIEAQRKKQEEEASAIIEAQRKKQEEEAAAIIEAQRKKQEEEAAAIIEAQRKKQEEEAAAIIEAQRKKQEEEAAAIIEAQLKKQEEEAAAIIEAQRKKQEEEASAIIEAQRKKQEEEAAAIIEAQLKKQGEEAAAIIEAQRKKQEEEASAVIEAQLKKQEEEATAFIEAQLKKQEEEAAARKEVEESARIERERHQADGQARLENENDENIAGNEDDEDWLTAVEIAQKGLEGKVVGLEEAILDKEAKTLWDAAQERARALNNPTAEDEDEDVDLDLGLDLDALGRAARAAVESYTSEIGYVDDENIDDDADFVDYFAGGDLEALAKAAKDAVKRFGEEDFEEGEDDSFEGIDGMVMSSSSGSGSADRSATQYRRDWSSLTVSKLKDELRLRGLKAYGKKTELISMLEKYDREQYTQPVATDEDEDSGTANSADDENDFFDMEEIDLEELGRQARAAVELGSMALDFDAEEPSDEILMQLENEESMLLDLSFDDETTPLTDTAAKSQIIYASMTVPQLREELRRRDLKSVGKKSELIERLNEADLS